MSAELFGTDGIRGPAGEYPMNDAGMVRIGRAVGKYFTEPGDDVLIGWDPRESSRKMVDAAAEGLVDLGVNVRKVGVIPTPGLAYLTANQRVKAGIMITASHNPYTDNGVKVFTAGGKKLTDDEQDSLNKLIESDVDSLGSGNVFEATELVKIYKDFLISCAGDFSFEDLKIAVDSANGAASGMAAEIFVRLGAAVTPMFDRPDGRNINVECGATDTRALQAAVKSQQLDCGVALDGDADRVIVVDEKGREMTGDHLLYILAVAGGHEGVVATIMSNQGLENMLKERGIGFTRTPVGDRSVLEGLQSSGFDLGGEQSGHIIQPKLNSTGDGLLAAVRVLALVISSGKSLAAWYDELKLLPQALVNLPLADKSLVKHPDIQAYIAEKTRELGTNGRLNVRPSGTEPKLRIMVEAPNAEEQAGEIAERITKLAERIGA